ncbi:MAG: ATP phosphoribosyltransferase [Chloroflexi bacterium HGW-Chloroflexi-6]|nr:MAG: ATP phosphoribosyltransferase [Chloroflexi bacterium HGW-Chloroflexi-6]
MPERPIRLSLPSKGRLFEETVAFLAACGIEIYKPNPRQYEATVPSMPGVTVLFQRPTDIVISVRNGSVDFGITGLDVMEEYRGENGDILVLHEALGYGKCALALAVPEGWEQTETVTDLSVVSRSLGRPLKVATKFPVLTSRFLKKHQVPFEIVSAEGTLEIAPAIGYADMISDLVSSGQTLRDNRLRSLSDGTIQASQSVLIANKACLARPDRLAIAQQLLELIEAHLRAHNNLSIFANMRGESPEAIASRVFAQKTIGGLNGPTVSRIIHRDGDPNWYAMHIVIHRDELFAAISELRSIGGSGVVVAPVTYIFEEEPPRYKAMLEALK